MHRFVGLDDFTGNPMAFKDAGRSGFVVLGHAMQQGRLTLRP